MRLHLLATTALVLGSVGSAHAYTYFDTYNVGSGKQNDGADTANPASTSFYDGVVAVGQSFYTPTNTANSVTLYLSDTTAASDGGSVKVYLSPDPGTTTGVATAPGAYSPASGTFSGQLIGTIADSALSSTTPTAVTLNFTPTVTGANKEYWIEAASNKAEFWYEKGSNGTGLANQSSWYYSTTSAAGTLHLDSETNPYEMVVSGPDPSGAAVPEPVSAASLGSALVGLGVLRRRAKRPA